MTAVAWLVGACASGPSGEDAAAASPQGEPFRATGNEPNWVLDVGPDSIVLMDYSQQSRTSMATPKPTPVDGGVEYAASSGSTEMRVLVSNKVCADTMSGMPFPKTVEVRRTGAATLRGCGGRPLELLLGNWVIQSIDDAEVAAPGKGTLRFDASGTVSGKAFCNSFSGPYTLTGEGLSFANLASTMMACPEPLSTLESQMHSVLRDVARFEIAPDGALVLRTNDGRRLTARR